MQIYKNKNAVHKTKGLIKISPFVLKAIWPKINSTFLQNFLLRTKAPLVKNQQNQLKQ